jgi:hypothetical protein
VLQGCAVLPGLGRPRAGTARGTCEGRARGQGRGGEGRGADFCFRPAARCAIRASVWLGGREYRNVQGMVGGHIVPMDGMPAVDDRRRIATVQSSRRR